MDSDSDSDSDCARRTWPRQRAAGALCGCRLLLSVFFSLVGGGAAPVLLVACGHSLLLSVSAFRTVLVRGGRGPASVRQERCAAAAAPYRIV